MLSIWFEKKFYFNQTYISINNYYVTVLSATWPLGVRRLAQTYMNNPIQVYVGSLDLAATHTVTQTIELIDENDKESKVCCIDPYVVKAAKFV